MIVDFKPSLHLGSKHMKTGSILITQQSILAKLDKADRALCFASGMAALNVPIVASTGGLVDTVKEVFTGFQMGAFNVECEAVDPADIDAVAKTVKRALAVHGTPALT